MLDYDFDTRGSMSLYEFLYRSIRDDIESSILAPGSRLPSKRSLAQHLGVSLITVENAYAQLVTEGYCLARPRSGYYVAELSFPTRRDAQAPIREREVEVPAHVPFDLTRVTVDASMVARVWGRALRGALSRESDEELYAPQPSQGTLRLRRAIAARLRQTRGIEADPACIVVGAGAQLLDAALAQLLRCVGTCSVALENPGYPRLAQLYEAAGLEVRPVSLDAEGMAMTGLRSSGAQLVHVMPSHQFPTGIVTSIARRCELLEWAGEEEGRFIIEDDYDAPFRLAGRPVASLMARDSAGRVIYTNTFSKSLGPALRMAFMALPPDLAGAWSERVGFYANTVSVVDQIALARMLESGDYERHVNRYRKAQRDVRDAFLDELALRMPANRYGVEEVDSGLHFVLAIAGADGGTIAAAALERGVRLAPLGDYALDGLPVRDDARFAIQYGGLDVDAAREAARLIAACV